MRSSQKQSKIFSSGSSLIASQFSPQQSAIRERIPFFSDSAASPSRKRWTLPSVLSHPHLVKTERENFDGKGLSSSLSAFWETRPSPHLLLSCGVFERRALTGKVSGQFLTWICIPQWRVTALKGQEKTGASIGLWKLFKETDELKEQRGSHTFPPSLHPCKPPLALKNRTSLNCATRCLYHRTEGGWRVRGFVEGSELRHKRAINSAPPSVLFCCIRKQQVVTVHSHDDTTPGTLPGIEGVHTHTRRCIHTVNSTYRLYAQIQKNTVKSRVVYTYSYLLPKAKPQYKHEVEVEPISLV